MQICRSSSYVKYVSSCSPATSLCPNPDSLEMRLNSISDRPSSTAARRRVTYFNSCVFMSALSRWKKHHRVFFNRQDHGLVYVYVPAFADPHPYGFAANFQQFPAQRHLDISHRHLQNHRMTDPSLERILHLSVPP